jgi:hypothetical protein
MISEIKKHILDIRVIQIPEAENRRFIIFISASDKFPLRAKSRDTVNINFAPNVDDCNDDWYSKIAKPAPFGCSNNLTILITRPWWKREKNQLSK